MLGFAALGERALGEIIQDEEAVVTNAAATWTANITLTGSGHVAVLADSLTGTGHAATANTTFAGAGFALALDDTLTTQES